MRQTHLSSLTCLVPRRSVLICCPREVWERAGEYLSVTSQLMVESRNDRTENARGLGCSLTTPFLYFILSHLTDDDQAT